MKCTIIISRLMASLSKYKKERKVKNKLINFDELIFFVGYKKIL